MADSNPPSGATYSLPHILDMSALSALMDDIREHLRLDNALILDAGNVDRIGTPAIQLLLSAHKSAANDNKKIYFVNPSKTFSSAFQDLGLGAELEQWSKLPW